MQTATYTKKLKFFIFSLLFFGMIGMGTAQVTFDPDVDDEAPAAPIDGFIAISLVAGACIGLRKHLKK